MTLCLALLLAGALEGAPAVRVGTFRVDATPPLGEPLIWVMPAARVLDPLLAKGIVLESGGKRYVMCAVDWCGIGGEIHRMLRSRMAAAAGADTASVELHVLHQHTAPYLEGDGYRLLASLPNPPLMYSKGAIELLAKNLAAGIEKARSSMTEVDSIGLGQAEVDRVASARRIRYKGKLVTRYSSTAKSPGLALEPEGPIDRFIKTITLARGNKPVVRLHYYATHPQTFCCEGTVTADFVGAAREAAEKQDGVPQVYFTGAAGDVTVGKYNDGTIEKRRELEARLLEGIGKSIRATRYQPLREASWHSVALELPIRPASDPVVTGHREKLNNLKAGGVERYRGAIGVAFNERKRPIDISALFIGPAVVVHLPGEPLLDYQKYAQQQSAGRFVAVAGYGDIAPGYICPDLAHQDGGYEPSASNSAPGGEAAMKAAIRKLLTPPAGLRR